MQWNFDFACRGTLSLGPSPVSHLSEMYVSFCIEVHADGQVLLRALGSKREQEQGQMMSCVCVRAVKKAPSVLLKAISPMAVLAVLVP